MRIKKAATGHDLTVRTKILKGRSNRQHFVERCTIYLRLNFYQPNRFMPVCMKTPRLQQSFRAASMPQNNEPYGFNGFFWTENNPRLNHLWNVDRHRLKQAATLIVVPLGEDPAFKTMGISKLGYVQSRWYFSGWWFDFIEYRRQYFRLQSKNRKILWQYSWKIYPAWPAQFRPPPRGNKRVCSLFPWMETELILKAELPAFALDWKSWVFEMRSITSHWQPYTYLVIL